ncbi:MAG TPA: gamma-glutamyltransferase [Rhizomicrobium sp.]
MRDFQKPGRSAVYGERGMVATSHPFASREAALVLTEGGSAADAAIAAAAVLCVAEPQMTGIGGDCFWIHADAAGAVLACNGSGRTPRGADASWYARHNITALEPWSAHAVTIPGAVDAWCRLHAAKGRLPLARLLAPAIRLAEEGCIVHPRVALDWAFFRDRVARNPAARAAFTKDGASLRAGDRFANPALGATLRIIAAQGRAAFYAGSVAANLTALLRNEGGLHTEEDFAAQESEFVEPIRTTYRDHTILECPPNGQGMAALIALNILAQYDLAGTKTGEALRTHLFAEATKLAYAERNAWCADPGFADGPLAQRLSAAHARELASQIDPRRAMTAPKPAAIAHRDTVYLAVVDRDLNAVSFINSIFHGFGSGLFDPKTGVLLHNRGLGFCFDPQHPNAIGAAKRPMHTIIPGFAFDSLARPWMPFGVMGGQYQASGHAQFIVHVVERGLDPQQAIEQPRSFAFDGSLEVESGFDAGVLSELAGFGHKLRPAAEPIGGAQAIQIDHARGILIAGSDPRKDGLAIGL